MNDDVDAGLRDRLDALEVPDHRPGYRDEVVRLLEEEAAKKAEASRFGRAFGGRRLRLAAGLAAAAAVVVYVLVALPGAEEGGAPPMPPTLAGGTVSASTTVRGNVTLRISRNGRQTVESGWFTADGKGNFRLETAVRRSTESAQNDIRSRFLHVYDVARRTSLSVYWKRRQPTEAYVASGIPLRYGRSGDQASPFEYQEWGTAVRAAAATGDPSYSVADVTVGDRPAWKAEVDARGRHTEIAVDKQTGLVVQFVVESLDGQQRLHSDELLVTGLQTGVILASETFSTRPPRGAHASTGSDSHFHFGSLHEASTRVGYAPLTPDWLPSGYAMAEVTTAPLPHGPYVWINPMVSGPFLEKTVPDNETDILFARGLDEAVLMMVPSEGAWYDSRQAEREATTRMAWPGTGRRIELRSGAFAGTEAQTWFNSRGAGLLATNDRYTVLVSGALTRAEIVRLAESLRPFTR